MTNEQKEKIIRFRNMGMSFSNIGHKLDISKDTIKSFCHRHGITVLDSMHDNNWGICRECGNVILQKEKQKKKIFCSKSCREKWWTEHADMIKRKAIYTFTCAGCGKIFSSYGNKNRKYCSHACYIADRFGGGDIDE